MRHRNIPIRGNIWILNTSSIICNRSPNLRTQLFYTSVISDIIVIHANKWPCRAKRCRQVQ